MAKELLAATLAPADSLPNVPALQVRRCHANERSLTFAVARQLSPAKFLEAYGRFLEHLALALSPADFLALLPPNGSASFYLPYVERCYANMCAGRLRQSIEQEQELFEQEEAKAAEP